MLGSIVVAVITVSLLFVGVYLGNSQKADTTATDKAEPYDEGFFGSVDTLVGGLGQFAERGKEAREDRYQEYLKTQERIAETNELLEPTSDTASSKPATQQAKTVATVSPKTEETPPSNQNQAIVAPSLPRIVPAPIVAQPEPPIPTIPPPSSVGVSDLSTRLDELFSSFDFEDDLFDDLGSDEGASGTEDELIE